MIKERTFPKRDFISGIKMAAILIPFSMAYSVNAGLPVFYGLSAAAIPPLMYLFFKTSIYASVGPVAMLSLITFQGCYGFARPGTADYIEIVLLVTFMVGTTQLIAGIVKAGFLMSYLSEAVTRGFTYGAVLVIFTSQFRHVLGVDIDPAGSMIQLLYRVLLKTGEINVFSLALGVTSIIMILVLEKRYPVFPAPLVVVVLGSFLTAFLGLETKGVVIVGDIETVFPYLSMPLRHIEKIPELLPLIFTLVVVGMMESVPISRLLASRSRHSFDIDEELKGLGMANLVSSFVRGYVVTGGVARTVFNYRSGVKTRISSVVTSIIVIVVVFMFRNMFYYIPQPVLSSLIMSSAISLFMTEDLRYLYRARRSDGSVLGITFITTVFIGVQWGLVIGILLSLVLILQKNIDPCAEELYYPSAKRSEKDCEKYIDEDEFRNGMIIRAKGNIHFANFHFIADSVCKRTLDIPSLKWIILDLENADDVDGVALMKIEELMDTCIDNEVRLHLSGVKSDLKERLCRIGWYYKFEGQIHDDLKSAVDKVGKKT